MPRAAALAGSSLRAAATSEAERRVVGLQVEAGEDEVGVDVGLRA